MPRHKEFDPEACLEQVMRLFWQKGYQETSMADLVKHSGVQRYGLYETFGGKQELFRRSLDLYLSTIISQRFVLFERKRPEPSLAAIEQFFGQFIELLEYPSSYFGCLIINTAVEVESHDEAVVSIVQQYFERLHRGFDRALKHAKQNGEIAASTDIAQVAEFLVGSVLGLTTYARSPVPRKDVQTYVRGILATLEHL
jgi:TetR/AcrR family transcriptional regulator, transcriptional repressor for nem operon